MIQYFWAYFFGVLAVMATVALVIAGSKLNQSTKRVARSYAPIGVKVKALGIEVSALRRSRSDRQRRLETDSPGLIQAEE
ncbi:MAG: hypothetical protein JHD31_01705 [Rhodoluna sp.]|jgi:hypothetical protein|nr:hypothetical protein [Rhodoluna sp.]